MFTGVQRCTVSWLVVNKVFYDCVSQLFKCVCVCVCVCVHICASLSLCFISVQKANLKRKVRVVQFKHTKLYL